MVRFIYLVTHLPLCILVQPFTCMSCRIKIRYVYLYFLNNGALLCYCVCVYVCVCVCVNLFLIRDSHSIQYFQVFPKDV